MSETTNNKTMKQFDPTKPCRTRGGDPVKILITDALGDLTIYYQNERTKMVFPTFANGLTWKGGTSHNDLINIPKKLVGWVNFYKHVEDPGFITATFVTEADARAHSNDPDYIETRKIEVEVPCAYYDDSAFREMCDGNYSSKTPDRGICRNQQGAADA